MQLELQALTVVHGFQQRLIALLLLDFHARTQQVADAGNPLRQRVLPPHRPLASAACRAEAAVHELTNRLQAGQVRLGNIDDAHVDQLKVGAAGRKPRMAGRVLAFDLPGQPCQPVEQFGLFVAPRAANGFGQPRQLAFGAGQHAGGFTRRWQPHQRRHAVGFDFQQLLHQPAQSALRQTAHQQQHPRKSVRMDGKVGVDLTAAVCHGGRDQRVLLQQPSHHGRTVRRADGHHPDMSAGQATAGQCLQPVTRHDLRGCHRRIAVEGICLKRPDEGPSHKFGVHFPADSVRAQIHPDVGGCGVGHRQMTVTQQRRQVRTAGVALAGIREHHHMGNGDRADHRLGGTGVDFVVQRLALGVLARHGEKLLLTRLSRAAEQKVSRYEKPP